MTFMDRQVPLTPVQQAVLAEFERRAQAGEPPPSHHDLMALMGWKSPAAARYQVAAMAKKGVLRIAPGRSRGAHLPGALIGKVPQVEELTQSGRLKKIIQYISLPTQLFPGDKGFAFNVSDDTLKHLGVAPPGLVIAVRGSPPGDAELVVVADGGKPRVTTPAAAAKNGQRATGTVKYVIRFFEPVGG